MKKPTDADWVIFIFLNWRNYVEIFYKVRSLGWEKSLEIDKSSKLVIKKERLILDLKMSRRKKPLKRQLEKKLKQGRYLVIFFRIPCRSKRAPKISTWVHILLSGWIKFRLFSIFSPAKHYFHDVKKQWTPYQLGVSSRVLKALLSNAHIYEYTIRCFTVGIHNGG